MQTKTADKLIKQQATVEIQGKYDTRPFKATFIRRTRRCVTLDYVSYNGKEVKDGLFYLSDIELVKG